MKTQKEIVALLSEQVSEIKLAQVKDAFRKVEEDLLNLKISLRTLKDPALLKRIAKVESEMLGLKTDLISIKQW